MGVSCSARTREGARASDWGGRVSGGLGRGGWGHHPGLAAVRRWVGLRVMVGALCRACVCCLRVACSLCGLQTSFVFVVPEVATGAV